MGLKKTVSRLIKRFIAPKQLMFTPGNVNDKKKCECNNVEKFVVKIYGKKGYHGGEKIICKNCIFEECNKGNFVEVIM